MKFRFRPRREAPKPKIHAVAQKKLEFDGKDKTLSYLTTNILKLSATINLNFENKIFVDLNLFFRTTFKTLKWASVYGVGCVKVVLKLSDK